MTNKLSKKKTKIKTKNTAQPCYNSIPKLFDLEANKTKQKKSNGKQKLYSEWILTSYGH